MEYLLTTYGASRRAYHGRAHAFFWRDFGLGGWLRPWVQGLGSLGTGWGGASDLAIASAALIRRTRPAGPRAGCGPPSLVGAGIELVSIGEEVGDAGHLEAPIFFTTDGWRIDPNNFRTRIWMPALAAAGLRYVKPYALRHTFATLLLSQGQSVKYVQEQLGHSSAVMTLNVYAKWLPREKREAPARFEAQLKAARPKRARRRAPHAE